MHYNPIVAATCESRSRNDPKSVIRPVDSQGFDLFPFDDPFGLRKAIVPVLLNDEGVIKGMGTAFHVDGWGTFLTADHVIASIRQQTKAIPDGNGNVRHEIRHPDLCPTLLLGLGLVYGQPRVPEAALALVTDINSPIQPKNDPLAALRGQPEIEVASDIAVMRLVKPVPDQMQGTLPIRLSGVPPKEGDEVVAIGFPELDSKPLNDEETHLLLSEGMHAAYGQIVGIHPRGLRNHPTPGIEVKANWPPGMSGGPVFNQRGEVIALVSCAWSDVGYAGCLSMMPWLKHWLPTIDAANPGRRTGWAVLKNDYDLVGFHRRKEEALQHQSALGSGCAVEFGSNLIGTDEFI